MSSSEGCVASGSALCAQPAGGAPMDFPVMTPSNKRANRSDDSAESPSRFWVTESGGGSSGDDGFEPVIGKGKALKKKKKIRLSAVTLDAMRKTGSRVL